MSFFPSLPVRQFLTLAMSISVCWPPGRLSAQPPQIPVVIAAEQAKNVEAVEEMDLPPKYYPRWSSSVITENVKRNAGERGYTFSGNSIVMLENDKIIRRSLAYGRYGILDVATLNDIYDCVFGNDQQGYILAESSEVGMSYLPSLDKGITCRLLGHKIRPDIVKFSSDGKRLLTTSLDKTIRLWSLEDGKELKAFVFNPEDNPPMPPAEKSWQRGDFTPDGKHAVILEKEFLLVVKAENGELVHRWGNYQKGPSFGGDNELLVLPNGKEALVYHGYEVIRINLWTGAWNVVAKKAGDSYIFNLQAIDKQQKFLYVDAPSELAAPDQPPLRITLWDADFKTLVKSRPLPYAGGWLIDPANSILAVFLWHEIKFFSLKDAQLSPIKSPINYDIENSKDIEFSPDGKYLVMVKNTPTGEQLLVWDAPKNQSSK